MMAAPAGRATLMLLLLAWWMRSGAFSVDPPSNIKISDPGHLGPLEISWTPPASLRNNKDCPTLYQLDYFNYDLKGWRAVRTKNSAHTVHFNLSENVWVRLRTLLGGPCADGVPAESQNYTELVQEPPTGLPGTAVRNFTCVFYSLAYVKCTWETGSRTPANSKRGLYFWHAELSEAEECPEYLASGEDRIGCDFTGKRLPDFTDVNFLLNGSSPEGDLQPVYFSLQIQNYVKPAKADNLRLEKGSDERLELSWRQNAMRGRLHCLQWEVEHLQDGPDGQKIQVISSDHNTKLSVTPEQGHTGHCFRVRSRMTKFCTSSGFWSEWSRRVCHPEQQSR